MRTRSFWDDQLLSQKRSLKRYRWAHASATRVCLAIKLALLAAKGGDAGALKGHHAPPSLQAWREFGFGQWLLSEANWLDTILQICQQIASLLCPACRVAVGRAVEPVRRGLECSLSVSLAHILGVWATRAGARGVSDAQLLMGCFYPCPLAVKWCKTTTELFVVYIISILDYGLGWLDTFFS